MADDERLVVATIKIERLLGEQDIIYVEAVDTSGESLPLVELLGMLRIAEDTVIRLAMGEGPDEDDEP
jgi:hypothetical protein